MPRSKARYANVLDNAFVDVYQLYQMDAFELEVYASGCIVLALGEELLDDDTKEAISKMMTKIALKHPKLPSLAVEAQDKLPF